MRDKILAAIVFAAMLTLALPVSGAATEVCPEQGKVESVVDGDLDNIVLQAGTEVCIKGGDVLVTVTADGTSTLAQLLDNRNEQGELRNVSHYAVVTVITTAQETTTTEACGPSECEPPTTTTVQETTTTEACGPSECEPPTTTTVQETTTTEACGPSEPGCEPPTTVAVGGTLESLPEVRAEIGTALVLSASTSIAPAEELPFTGVPLGLGVLAGLVALTLGGLLVRSSAMGSEERRTKRALLRGGT